MVGTRSSAGLLCNVFLPISEGHMKKLLDVCLGDETETLLRHSSDRRHIFPLFQVQMSVYFLGHVFFLVAFLSVPYLRKALVPKKERGPSKQDWTLQQGRVSQRSSGENPAQNVDRTKQSASS